MTDQERQRQMDFILEQQARFESDIAVGQRELAQIRRMLISAIRLARRERSDTRAKLDALTDAQIRMDEQLVASEAQFTFKMNALTDAQIRNEGSVAAFRAQTAENVNALKENLVAFQGQVGQALSDVAQALGQTNRRIDSLDETRGNGDGSQR